MLLARGRQKKLDCGGQISPTLTYAKGVTVEKVFPAPVNAASPRTLLGWLRSGITVEWRRFHPKFSLSLTKSRSDMVKLAWQLLSLGSDQSAGLWFRLPVLPHTEQSLGHGLMGAAAISLGCQHCQWGNSLQLRHNGDV